LNNLSQAIIEYRCMPEANLVSIAGELRHYRRKKVLELGLKGMNQVEIAAELGISLSTVKRTFYTIRKTCRIKALNHE
jgi:DNA-directed RNA polymerase specialized sigma24 family protein